MVLLLLSHDNITWTAKAVLDLFVASEEDHLVSYLPLSHIAAAMLDVYGAFCFRTPFSVGHDGTLTYSCIGRPGPCVVGYTVSFAQPDALKGSLVHTLRDVQPTVFFGVPRVYACRLQSCTATCVLPNQSFTDSEPLHCAPWQLPPNLTGTKRCKRSFWRSARRTTACFAALPPLRNEWFVMTHPHHLVLLLATRVCACVCVRKPHACFDRVWRLANVWKKAKTQRRAVSNWRRCLCFHECAMVSG